MKRFIEILKGFIEILFYFTMSIVFGIKCFETKGMVIGETIFCILFGVGGLIVLLNSIKIKKNKK